MPDTHHSAPVRLRLSDGYEECEWDAIVGFVAAPMGWAILGHAGVLQYFDLQFLGLRRETLLNPNASYFGVPCDSSVVSSVKLRGGPLCCAHLHERNLLRQATWADGASPGC